MLKQIFNNLFLIFFVFVTSSCGELQQVINQIPQGTPTISNADIASGLQQALNQGIEEQVSKLAAKNGFYSNDLVKILLPDELQKVDKTLRNLGLGDLADQGLKLLNSAAEDAVKEATPIFVNAVESMTINDAKSILLGENNAATNYLIGQTGEQLYIKFKPIINQSFEKVGANQIWRNIISKYNAVPFTNNVNPDLTDYVTNEALKGVFVMIAGEELAIRTRYSSRTTDLLKKVFALQDR